jgi:hypothetical protein
MALMLFKTVFAFILSLIYEHYSISPIEKCFRVFTYSHNPVAVAFSGFFNATWELQTDFQRPPGGEYTSMQISRRQKPVSLNHAVNLKVAYSYLKEKM